MQGTIHSERSNEGRAVNRHRGVAFLIALLAVTSTSEEPGIGALSPDDQRPKAALTSGFFCVVVPFKPTCPFAVPTLQGRGSRAIAYARCWRVQLLSLTARGVFKCVAAWSSAKAEAEVSDKSVVWRQDGAMDSCEDESVSESTGRQDVGLRSSGKSRTMLIGKSNRGAGKSA